MSGLRIRFFSKMDPASAQKTTHSIDWLFIGHGTYWVYISQQKKNHISILIKRQEIQYAGNCMKDIRDIISVENVDHTYPKSFPRIYFRNPNQAARRAYGIKVVNIGRARMLKVSKRKLYF